MTTARRDGRDTGTDIGNTLRFEDTQSPEASLACPFEVRNRIPVEFPPGKRGGH